MIKLQRPKILLKLIPVGVLVIGILVFVAISVNTRSGVDYPQTLERYIYSDEEKEKLIAASEAYIIRVKKEAHKLVLYKSGNVVKTYNVNVRAETDDRRFENDGQTPEGVFRVYQCAVVTSPAWTRWIAFNTAAKAREIFINEYENGTSILSYYEKEYGTIKNDADIRQFNKIHRETPMLRGFGIHGGGYRPGRDWTLGCPALDDADVIELYDYIRKNPDGGVGTYVIITD